MSLPYKALEIKQAPKVVKQQSKEESFWSKFRFPILLKQYAAVTSIDFSPVEPYNYAITSSTRVLIFDHDTNQEKKTISRFKDVAYGASFRHDGKLIVVGGEIPQIKIFDSNSKSLLRVLNGHKAAVHLCKFSLDNVHIFSGSDDKSVKSWDISTEQEIFSVQGHQDYIRCGAVNPASNDIFVTGGYDHLVKLWDVRNKQEVMSLDHKATVEAVLVYPGGNMACSAGSNYLKIWDLLTGTCLQTISNHQKPITALALDGEGTRLISGGLDHHVKIYDLKDYQVVAGLTYPAPILSLGISADNSRLVVGMADGMLSIKSRPVKKSEIAQEKIKQQELKSGTYRYFIRGKHSIVAKEDQVVAVERKKKLQDYDILLKGFQYRAALDAALKTHNPDIGFAMLEELEIRGGLMIALSGRDEDTLEPLLHFILDYINRPRYTDFLIHISQIVLDTYASILGQHPDLDKLFFKLSNKLHQEIDHQKHLFELLGSLDLILTSATLKGFVPSAKELTDQ